MTTEPDLDELAESYNFDHDRQEKLPGDLEAILGLHSHV